jgi:hypothetical protein
VVEEGKAQVIAVAEALQSGVGGRAGFVEGVRAEIGQFVGLDVAPDLSSSADLTAEQDSVSRSGCGDTAA